MKDKAIEIRISCVADKGCLPEYKSVYSSGADLKANIKQEIVIKSGKTMLVPTGLRIEIPQGYEAQVRPRSRLAYKHGITVLNSPGTIDSDYRGEVKVILANLGEKDFCIKAGDRIAQIIFAPIARADFNIVEEINNSQRGKGGFGSTGI